jgi:nucleoside-diphosphate-sugar epimerase
VHTASPVLITGESNHEDDIIKPAVEGTLAVLRAAHKHKVKRVIITASVASIIDMINTPKLINESHWANE